VFGGLPLRPADWSTVCGHGRDEAGVLWLSPRRFATAVGLPVSLVYDYVRMGLETQSEAVPGGTIARRES